MGPTGPRCSVVRPRLAGFFPKPSEPEGLPRRHLDEGQLLAASHQEDAV